MKGEFISIESARINADIEKENKELQQRIDKAIEYIKEKYDYVLGDMTFLDHDELIDRKQMIKLLNILEGKDENI